MKVVPEPSERCTTAIACFGSLAFGIELGDRRIVPVLDLAQEDLGERRAVERDVAALDAFEIDDRHDAAHHGRELDDADLVELFRLQRHVGGAEGHGLGADLLDAAAGADRLIVQAVAGLLLVGVGPLGVDRIREGRAGAGNVDGDGRIDDGGGDGAGRENCPDVFHSFSPVMSCQRLVLRGSATHGKRLRLSWFDCGRDADTQAWPASVLGRRAVPEPRRCLNVPCHRCMMVR